MIDPVLAIITRLKADTAIAAIVSTRIYRIPLPASPTFPAITVSRVDGKREAAGDCISRTATSRIQCTAWAASDGAADNLSELIADNLHLVTAYQSGVHIISIIDAGTVPDNNPDIPIYMYHRDFLVNYAY